MLAPPLNRASLAFVASLALQLPQPVPASAQAASSAAPSTQASPPELTSPEPDSTADLVERLMTSDAEEEDLEWLFSNADEYAPTGLSGKPLDAPVLPRRGEGSRREWNPSWRKFGLGNYVLSGGSILVAVAATTIAPKAPRTTGRNDFDEWGRRHLSAGDYHSGLWARDVSDVLVSVNIAFPLLIDSLVVTHWYRRSEEVAGQMALITSEVIAVTAALQTVTSTLAARERPYVRDCGATLDAELEDCQESDRLRSFFSGHTSNAFAGAAVACSHHATHDLFGDPMADGLACAFLFLSAGTTGIMRVVGHRHYLSDILTGATVGTLTGLGLPWLLHYGPLARGKAVGSGAVQHPSLHLVPLLNGLAVGGTF